MVMSEITIRAEAVTGRAVFHSVVWGSDGSGPFFYPQKRREDQDTETHPGRCTPHRNTVFCTSPHAILQCSFGTDVFIIQSRSRHLYTELQNIYFGVQSAISSSENKASTTSGYVLVVKWIIPASQCLLEASFQVLLQRLLRFSLSPPESPSTADG